MRYVVVYEQSPRNWSAYVPDLPACIAAAKTRRGTERLIKGAVKMYLEAAVEFGEPIPEPGTWTGTVDVDLPASADSAPTETAERKSARRRASA